MKVWNEWVVGGALAALICVTAYAKEIGPVYAESSRLDMTRFLAPPPDAVTTAREIEYMLEIQKKRTPEQVARSIADVELNVFRFADVLGPAFNKQDLPQAAAFFKRLHDTRRVFTAQGKQHWLRLRPPLQDKRLQPVATYTSQGSYPSGHTTSAWLWAITLAEMVPEKRAEIFARAREFGDNRVVGGVHFPSDVEG